MEKTYQTRDLAESAALIINKQCLLRVERKGKICWFVFEDFQRCKQLSDTFFFGNLNVNAREFYETITRLKNRIFAGT